jgi:hypothetical protein
VILLLWRSLSPPRSCQIAPHAYHCHLTRDSIFDKHWVPSHDDSHKQEAAKSCRGGIECVVYTCSMFSSSYFPSLSHARSYVTPLRIPAAIIEPGVQTECDGCLVDLTHSIRIKCADPACAVGDGVDLCPNCFCSGKEFGKHKRGHAYRVEVSNTRCNPYNLTT